MKPIRLSIILGLAMTFVAGSLTVAAKEVTLAEVPSEVGYNTANLPNSLKFVGTALSGKAATTDRPRVPETGAAKSAGKK